jgi:hypothetical protein
MIEKNLSAPRLFVVAALAIFSLLTLVNIVELMAGVTSRLELVFEYVSGVTGFT